MSSSPGKPAKLGIELLAVFTAEIWKLCEKIKIFSLLYRSPLWGMNLVKGERTRKPKLTPNVVQ